ncbi:hypothetical protein EDB89DRAFT_1316186 [Lactarius sanguifluus]|nr:hypothetical protein EDB89DRAFT_1316186 [Lactarius sanguifluus]
MRSHEVSPNVHLWFYMYPISHSPVFVPLSLSRGRLSVEITRTNRSRGIVPLCTDSTISAYPRNPRRGHPCVSGVSSHIHTAPRLSFHGALSTSTFHVHSHTGTFAVRSDPRRATWAPFYRAGASRGAGTGGFVVTRGVAMAIVMGRVCLGTEQLKSEAEVPSRRCVGPGVLLRPYGGSQKGRARFGVGTPSPYLTGRTVFKC